MDELIDDLYDKVEGSLKTDEERKAYLESLGDPMKHPMFATSYEDLIDNPLADALRALKEEDKNPVELVVLYKDEGNMFIKRKDYFSAIQAYSTAMDFLEQARCFQMENDDPTDLTQLHSQLFSNRAISEFFLKNFGRSRDDARAAIRLWPQNIKAHFRLCKSLLTLNHLDECLAACTAATEIAEVVKHATFRELSELHLTCLEKIRSKQIAFAEELERREERKQLFLKVWGDVRATQLKLKPTATTSSHAILGHPTAITPPEQLIDVRPGIDAESSQLHVPVLFLYPQYNEIDVVQQVEVTDMLVDHLAHMFPEFEEGSGANVDWDIHREYQVSNLVCYLQLHASPAIHTCEEWEGCCEEQWLCSGRSHLAESEDVEAAKHRFKERLQEFERECTSKKRSSSYVELHLGCTFGQLLCVPGYVLSGGLMSILVHIRGNEAHLRFLDTVKEFGKLRVLECSGDLKAC